MISLTKQWEKHQPLVIIKEENVIIKVGREIEHPMLEMHLIEIIDVLKYTKAGLLRVKTFELKFWEKPEIIFPVSDIKAWTYKIQARCNLHWTWDDDFVI